MVITLKSIFMLSSILALISTIILFIFQFTGIVEVPTPAIILLTFTSILLVSAAFVFNKKKAKLY